jgi:hypothetical protein
LKKATLAIAFVTFGVVAVIGLRAPKKTVPHEFSDPICQQSYQTLFGKDALDVRLFFGYKDARPARFVADRYEQMLFVQALLRPCRKDREDCGFAREVATHPKGEELFTKSIQGPDGRSRTISLTVTHSSVGPDDVANRENPFQKWSSQFARESFIDALKNADVVFYNGHSRSGGGPDFDPPVINSRDEVNYAWYRIKHPGLSVLENALIMSKNLKVLGLFSCASEQLFSKAVEKRNRSLQLISSRQLIYFSEALRDSLDSLSNLLGMKCPVD